MEIAYRKNYIYPIKRFFSISLLLLFLSNAFVFTFIQLNYEVNKERIIALFCVNKDKPMTMCYGKCYLNKQLTDTKEKKEQSGFQLNEMPVLQLHELATINIVVATFPLSKNNAEYIKLYSFLKQSKIFHPPRTI